MNKYQIEMVETAVEYAKRGWHVFPCSWKKAPATPNGFKDATTDEETIVQWWDRNPGSIIGIRTGKESGFWVVDIDEKNGKSGYQSLTDHFGDKFDFDMDEDLWAQTASGGFHLCFQYDSDNPVGSGANYLEGVDIRGDGGYIIAAPSSVKVGDVFGKYQWKDVSKDPRPAPEWALSLPTLRPASKPKSEVVSSIIHGVPLGARDESLFKLACLLEREGIDFDTARATISVIAERCTPPFDQAVALEKVERAFTSYRSINGVGSELCAIKKRISELTEQGL